MAADDFYAKVSTEIRKIQTKNNDGTQRIVEEDAVRFYCESPGGWVMQVRGKLRLARGQIGRDFVIATGHMYLPNLVALRDRLNDEIAEKTEQSQPTSSTLKVTARDMVKADGSPLKVGDTFNHGPIITKYTGDEKTPWRAYCAGYWEVGATEAEAIGSLAKTHPEIVFGGADGIAEQRRTALVAIAQKAHEYDQNGPAADHRFAEIYDLAYRTP
jgi:hypothetical protein